MHGRLFPRKNYFRYGMYYMALPLSQLDNLPVAHNKIGIMSFYDVDHGGGTGEALKSRAQIILASYNIALDGEIILVCMPRILGYVFNPVSFWLCYDTNGALKAVLCEVHNTFGEKHTYLCAHADGRNITPADTMKAQKVFHVSPFLPRDGHYEFRFDSTEEGFKVWIDYFANNGRKQLVTALTGTYQSLTKSACRRIFWKYPLITFKAIALIHYQAAKLLLKKIQYIAKPPQEQQHVSTTENLTKM